MFEMEETGLQGAYLLKPKIHRDLRGKFIKTFHADFFAEHGLETNFVEDFYSISKKHVLRGLHYQAPPHDHAKLVTCLHGNIQDVIVDIRRDSSTYGKHFSVDLSDKNAWLIYVPPGFAHGFLALADDVLVNYKTTTVHAPDYDRGVLWSSVGISWKTSVDPIVSERDKHHLNLAQCVI